MKLLKELFSFDDYDSEEEFGMGEDEEEFDFDFDFEEPEGEDDELDFNHDQLPYDDDDDMDMEMGDEYGADEDYPEDMMDMPHDDFEDDGEGGLVSDEGMEEEIGNIKQEIESLYARLGKLAAAGDLDLVDDADDFEDVDMEDDMDFSSFRDMDFDSDEPSFDEESMEFDDDDEVDLPVDHPEFR
jgi:hypothetical protein